MQGIEASFTKLTGGKTRITSTNKMRIRVLRKDKQEMKHEWSRKGGTTGSKFQCENRLAQYVTYQVQVQFASD